jgi:hypothetical protein
MPEILGDVRFGAGVFDPSPADPPLRGLFERRSLGLFGLSVCKAGRIRESCSLGVFGEPPGCAGGEPDFRAEGLSPAGRLHDFFSIVLVSV